MGEDGGLRKKTFDLSAASRGIDLLRTPSMTGFRPENSVDRMLGPPMLGGAVRSRDTSLLLLRDLLIAAIGGVAGGRSSRLGSPSCSVSEQSEGVVKSVSVLNDVNDS